ncbi:hypothetical protein K3495_g10347 [Podosphaera aphanis]|nr:hypothetical protein K3495_g10347 [Podosphaera aphanis]
MWISVTKRQTYGLGVSSMSRGKREILRQAKDKSYEAMMKSPGDAARITQWILNKGWFEQFRLAREVEAVLEDNVRRAVVNPPSFQPRRRSRWGSSSGQSALGALNGDEVARMLLQRESVSRSNSVPSIASSSLSSSAATIIQSNLPATGALMSAATDPGQLGFPTVRKKQPKTAQRFREKGDTVSNLNTTRNRFPSIIAKPEQNLQASTDTAPNHRQTSIPSPHQLALQTPSHQANGNRSTVQIACDNNPILYLLSTNGTFDRKTISVPFYPDCIRIGRQTNAKTMPTPSNGFFDSKVLSRQHAEIWADQDAKIWIKDVKSSNGTFVNGERLSAENQDSEPHELQSQDLLELGIDIVSEDQKTVIHHKVAAKIEYAGMPGPSNSYAEIDYGDFDPANNTLIMSAQALMQARGRADSLPYNNRLGALPNIAGQNLSMSQQRQMNFWLTPVTMEHIVKRLTHEIRQAKIQTGDLGKVHTFLGDLISDESITEVDKSPVGATVPAPSVNASFHSELKSRFSDPPAPPPQQPLPEKPDFARSSHPPSPSLKRSSMERSRSISRISSLVESLASAKKEILIQNVRLKDLEILLTRERHAKELAEETAKNLMIQPDVKSGEKSTNGDENSLFTEEAFEPPPESPECITIEMKELPTEEIVESHTINETTLMLEDRLEKTLKDMQDLRKQMETYKNLAEIAESNRDLDRKTIAELTEKIRLGEDSTKLPYSENTLTYDNKAMVHSFHQNKDDNDNKADNESLLAFTSTKEYVTNSSAHAPLAMESGAVAEILTKNNSCCDPMYHTAPYASMIGVVLIGVGIMACLNGWPPKLEH